jgi:hypothetical protein
MTLAGWVLLIAIGLIVLGAIITAVSSNGSGSTRVGWAFILIGVILFVLAAVVEYREYGKPTKRAIEEKKPTKPD